MLLQILRCSAPVKTRLAEMLQILRCSAPVKVWPYYFLLVTNVEKRIKTSKILRGLFRQILRDKPWTSTGEITSSFFSKKISNVKKRVKTSKILRSLFRQILKDKLWISTGEITSSFFLKKNIQPACRQTGMGKSWNRPSLNTEGPAFYKIHTLSFILHHSTNWHFVSPKQEIMTQ